MSARLAGKKAIVTGASRGIGEAIAAAFVKEGARVAICARKEEGLAEAAGRIAAGQKDAVFYRPCHVGRMEEINPFVEWALEKLGGLDILVNNAATNPHFGPALEADWPVFDKTFEVNLKSAFEFCRRVVEFWKKNSRGGSIVNIASIAGLRAAPMQGIYGMTKAALISLTQTLAVELGPLGIRVNAIAPGVVETRLSAVLVHTPEILKVFTDHTALKRHGRPEEIAPLAVFLASEESSLVTGQTFCADAGFTVA